MEKQFGKKAMSEIKDIIIIIAIILVVIMIILATKDALFGAIDKVFGSSGGSLTP